MDTDSNQTPSLSLPSSPSAQTDSAANGLATQQQTAPITAPPADDQAPDLLDQEWVSKAKQIVEKTKSDPFTESRELSKVKAEYLKARHDKDLMIGEHSPQ